MLLGVQLHIPPAHTLIEQILPVRNDEMTFRYKPQSKTGLWTSSYREETHDSDWVEWCNGENFDSPGEKQWFLLTPKADCNLYVIDSYADLERLLKDYPWMSPIAMRISDTVGIEYARYYRGIDFERLSKDYDGLHLTYEGNSRLHLSYPLSMNAWDSESTIWFRWCFSDVQCIETPKVMQEA